MHGNVKFTKFTKLFRLPVTSLTDKIVQDQFVVYLQAVSCNDKVLNLLQTIVWFFMKDSLTVYGLEGRASFCEMASLSQQGVRMRSILLKFNQGVRELYLLLLDLSPWFIGLLHNHWSPQLLQ